MVETIAQDAVAHPEESSSSGPTFGNNDSLEQQHAQENQQEMAATDNTEEDDAAEKLRRQEEAELESYMQQMWAMYEINMNKMLALHEESHRRMLEKLPPEILDMEVSEFMRRAQPGGDLYDVGQLQYELVDTFDLLGQQKPSAGWHSGDEDDQEEQ